MPVGLGHSIALIFIVTILKVSLRVAEINDSTPEEIVRRVQDVVIVVPYVKDNRRRRLQISHIVKHLDRLEIDRVQTVLNHARSVGLALWVPNRDVGVRRAVRVR